MVSKHGNVCPQTEGYHTDLALAYVNQTLEAFSGQDEPPEAGETRGKLQELLWSSMSYDVPAVHRMWTRCAIILNILAIF